MKQILPEGFARGQLQGKNIIGEITESLHRYLLDGWTFDAPPPRLEEDLSFIPKDREEVIYIYMYKAHENTALRNTKRWRPAPFSFANSDGEAEVYYERAPLFLELNYLICVHSKFRSDAERLLGWVILRLHEATHMVYRPKRYTLPDGREVDSLGRPWNPESSGDGVFYEKVSMMLTDELTVGDSVNFFTLHEAPYRPYLTYKARCAMDGALLSAPPTIVRAPRADSMESHSPGSERPNGRIRNQEPPTGPKPQRTPFGPTGYRHRPLTETQENED
jgi:hypothetical protein